MRYVRREMDFSDFWTHIEWGFWVAAVVIVLFMISIALMTTVRRIDRIAEQNLYAELQGKLTNDKTANQTAAFVYLWHRGEGILDPKLLAARFRASNSPNSIQYAMEHWDRVKAILDNPERAEIKVTIPSWGYWFKIAGLASAVLLAVSVSGSYIIATMANHQFGREEVWQYPWNRVWAYLVLPFMSPYIVTTQPFVLLHGGWRVARRRSGIQSEAPREQSSTSAQEHRGNYREKKRKARARIHDMRAYRDINRQRWIEVRSNTRVFQERNRVAAEVKSRRDILQDFGTRIESSQRALAQSEQKLGEIETIIANNGHLQESAQEFEELVNVPGVAEVEVETNGAIRVYTKMVYIGTPPHSLHEIGIFEIRLREGKMTIHNLCSTYKKGGHPHGRGGANGDPDGALAMCFGRMATRIYEHLEQREYVFLISLVVQSLHSYSLSGVPVFLLGHWKKVLKKEKERYDDVVE